MRLTHHDATSMRFLRSSGIGRTFSRYSSSSSDGIGAERVGWERRIHVECSSPVVRIFIACWGEVAATPSLVMDGTGKRKLQQFSFRNSRTSYPEAIFFQRLQHVPTRCSVGICRRRSADLMIMQSTTISSSRSHSEDEIWIFVDPDAINARLMRAE